MANINKIIENADEAYYAADYEKAIRYYQQALELDPDNEHSRRQLKKAEINRSSKDTKIQDLPVKALQFYKRSRSFIRAGDLAEAKKLLRHAIDIAKESGVDFVDAKQLLDNLQNAVKADAYRKKALEDLDTQQWAKAEENLERAFAFDPTDGLTITLREHLKILLKAQNLINSLNAGGVRGASKSRTVREIREIIDLTSETTSLSSLWQEVVRQFGDYNNFMIPQGVSRVVFIFLVMSGIIGGLSAFYNWSGGIVTAIILFSVAVILYILTLFSVNFWK